MDEIVKMIATYGIIPVFLALMIFVIVGLMKKMASQEERLTQLLNMINKNTDPVHTPEEEEHNLSVNMEINKLISNMRVTLGANRVTFYSFHNGGKDSTGRSYQKMSMVHEDVDYNTVSVMKDCQNLQRMIIPFLLEQLKEHGCYLIDDLNELKGIDQITYQMFAIRGVKSVYVKAIKDTDGRMLGFVTVEYTLNERKVDIQVLKDELKEKTSRIGGLLVGSNNLHISHA